VQSLAIPGLGTFSDGCGLIAKDHCSDGAFHVGRDGVLSVVATADGKVEFVSFRDHALAYVRSAMGYSAYYPVRPVELQKPILAVLMDLDGTTVRSERFWVWIIERTVASLLGSAQFAFDEADVPHVSGHSVSEHLQYCITRYCPEATVEQARRIYLAHARREMQEIAAGRGSVDAFVPAPGLKHFLTELKSMGVRVGLVSSGLHEKAYPEILAAFKATDMGTPEDFYDVMITAGFPLGSGLVGTLGELEAKPHPWLYAEAFRVGLGIEYTDRGHVVGIEDSGAGVCAIRLAGLATIGVGGGNVIESGMRPLCHTYCETLADVLDVIA
jgi:beta-phosphoglucomutase